MKKSSRTVKRQRWKIGEKINFKYLFSLVVQYPNKRSSREMNREMEKKLLRKSTKNMFSTEGHKFVDWESRMPSTKKAQY